MLRCLIVSLVSVFAISVARAVTVTWSAPAWNDRFMQVEDFDVYLVSSATEWTQDNWMSGSPTGQWSSDSVVAGMTSSTSATNSANVGHVADGKMNSWANFNVELMKGAYYYLVFVGKDSSGESDSYAMTSGVQYNPENAMKDGFLINQEPPLDPSYVNFPDHTWIYSDIVGTPEPTVFGLLVLGVAGLALRRRVTI